MEEARRNLPLVKQIHDRLKPRWWWRRVVALVLFFAVVVGALLAIGINFSRVPWVVAYLTPGP